MASPSTHHAPSAAHSGQPKLPGTAGISFMQMMATLTTAPPAAMTTPLRSRLRRASAMNARHAAHQPIPATAEADLGDRHEQRVTEKCRGCRDYRDECDRDRGRAEPRVDGGQRRMHQLSPSQRVQEARRGDEVSIEDLEEREQRSCEDEPRDPRRAERAREWRLCPEVVSVDLLPEINPRHYRHKRSQEQSSSEGR